MSPFCMYHTLKVRFQYFLLFIFLNECLCYSMRKICLTYHIEFLVVFFYTQEKIHRNVSMRSISERIYVRLAGYEASQTYNENLSIDCYL